MCVVQIGLQATSLLLKKRQRSIHIYYIWTHHLNSFIMWGNCWLDWRLRPGDVRRQLKN